MKRVLFVTEVCDTDRHLALAVRRARFGQARQSWEIGNYFEKTCYKINIPTV